MSEPRREGIWEVKPKKPAAFDTGPFGRGILHGIPTLGMLHYRSVLSLQSLGTPISFSLATMFVKGKPVHDARNMIVEKALEDGMTYVFFRDDDVLIPPDALSRLYTLASGDFRMRQLLGEVPRDAEGAQIIGGVYYSKTVPPTPLIMGDNWGGGYEDWVKGDILPRADGKPEVAAIGMGCTLIHTDVFRNIEPPWFETLAPHEIGASTMFCCTEDVYFCKKARDAGYTIYVDTGTQCSHLDTKTETEYRYDDEMKCAVWVPPNGQRCSFPPIGHPARKNMDEKIKEKCHPGEKLYIGSETPPKGYIKPDKPLLPFYRDAEAILDDGTARVGFLPHQIGQIVEETRALKEGGELKLRFKKAVGPENFENNGQRYEQALFMGDPICHWTEPTIRTLMAQHDIEVDAVEAVDGTYHVTGRKVCNPSRVKSSTTAEPSVPPQGSKSSETVPSSSPDASIESS